MQYYICAGRSKVIIMPVSVKSVLCVGVWVCTSICHCIASLVNGSETFMKCSGFGGEFLTPLAFIYCFAFLPHNIKHLTQQRLLSVLELMDFFYFNNETIHNIDR